MIQENIVWFTKDSINKSLVKNNVINASEWKKKNTPSEKLLAKNNIKNYYSKELTLFDTEEKAVNGVGFENRLINVLKT